MTEEVRVRFAPSPTGDPHVGNIRTALFNWLFARRNNGAFVVRIEDTDQERKTPGALEAILESLEWLGIDWDEGPEGSDGASRGPYAPYFQSQRLGLYRDAAERLLADGAAYPCFCAPERLDAMRKAQQQRREPPGYDRHCLTHLSEDERRERAAGGEPHVVRFRVPHDAGAVVVDDAIRGEVTYDPALLDDFVLLKSDGFPTYHLANVVDDHSMAISHVLRAEEWLSSAPRHLLLYRALGLTPPVLAHLPMILGPDRAKLSKRHGATSALAYRDGGYLPEALTNFMALLGWSLDDHTEILSRDELAQCFSLERVGKAGAIFDADKLTWMNGLYLREMPAGELALRLVPFLERPAADGGLPDSVPRPIDAARVAALTPLIQERLKRLDEAPELLSFFFEDAEALPPPQASALTPKGMDAATARDAVAAATARLAEAGAWDEDALEASLRPLAEDLGIKAGQLFTIVRVAVTGRSVSPPLFGTMAALGRERCLDALRRAEEALA